MNTLFYIFLTVCCFLIYNSSIAHERDIDSLKKILPSLHDSSKVDCFIEIDLSYYYSDKPDSMEHYLALAYEESKELNYAHGIAVTLFQKAALQNPGNNFSKEEELATESLQYYSQTSNKKYIEIAYYELGLAFFGKSIYDKAIINFKQSFECAKKAGSYEWMLQALSFIGQVYGAAGKYDSAFTAFKQELEIAQQNKDVWWISGAYTGLGYLYKAIEDYPTALEYYSKYFRVTKMKDATTWDYTIYAELFSLTNQYDSALYYYIHFDPGKVSVRDLGVFLVSKGKYLLLRKQYDSALNYFLKALAIKQQLNNPNGIEDALLGLAKTYAAQNDNKAALQYAKQGLALALQKKSRQYVKDGYQILYSVYDGLHKTDSAYFYYRQYIAMKDVVLSDQIKVKLTAYNYEQKISLLNEEEELQQQQLKQSSQQKIFLIIGILGTLLLGIFILRNALLKRKNEKHHREIAENELQLQKLESQKQFSELEMQALRAQMNPHFIFNCLSSINSFILKSKTDEASRYLTKFSRLIRMVLNNSKQTFISLEDELETLRLYLDMEKLRFRNSFEYAFNLLENIEAENVFIPPLLLQPFAENAIWHGLMHKQEKGFLTFDFCVEEKYLTCVITDNGIGRVQAELLKNKSLEKQKSMGLKITAERLSLLNNQSGKQTFFTIEDLKDENGSVSGTGVHLKISYKTLNQV